MTYYEIRDRVPCKEIDTLTVAAARVWLQRNGWTLCDSSRGVGVECRHVDARLPSLRRDRERPGTAADVQHLLARLDRRLVEQGPLEDPLTRRQRHHAVVQRRERVETERRLDPSDLAHHVASGRRVAPPATAARRGSVKYSRTTTLSTPAKKHHTEMNQVA